MNKIQELAVKASLEKMVADGHISICTIDKILQITQHLPPKADYDILHLLHCVKFRDMDPELLKELPSVLQRVLTVEVTSYSLVKYD